jgi:hypothetical protein
VQDVRGSDRALSFSVLAKAAGLPLQPNPTVIIEFADGTYSKPPRTMSKLDLVHGADPKCAGQFHPTSDDPVADAAEITLGGTPMDGCIYRFTVLTQP